MHFEDISVDGRMILRWISKKVVVKFSTGFIWLG